MVYVVIVTFENYKIISDFKKRVLHCHM